MPKNRSSKKRSSVVGRRKLNGGVRVGGAKRDRLAWLANWVRGRSAPEVEAKLVEQGRESDCPCSTPCTPNGLASWCEVSGCQGPGVRQGRRYYGPSYFYRSCDPTLQGYTDLVRIYDSMISDTNELGSRPIGPDLLGQVNLLRATLFESKQQAMQQPPSTVISPQFAAQLNQMKMQYDRLEAAVVASPPIMPAPSAPPLQQQPQFSADQLAARLEADRKWELAAQAATQRLHQQEMESALRASEIEQRSAQLLTAANRDEQAELQRAIQASVGEQRAYATQQAADRAFDRDLKLAVQQSIQQQQQPSAQQQYSNLYASQPQPNYFGHVQQVPSYYYGYEQQYGYNYLPSPYHAYEQQQPYYGYAPQSGYSNYQSGYSPSGPQSGYYPNYGYAVAAPVSGYYSGIPGFY